MLCSAHCLLWDDVAYTYHVSLIVVDSRNSLHKRAEVHLIGDLDPVKLTVNITCVNN